MILRVILTIATALALAASALGDTLVLADGTRYEGRVVREIDGAVYFEYEVGGITQTRLFLDSQIERIIREEAEETPAAPANKRGEPARPRTASPGAARIAFISLEEMVGPFMNADALERSVEMLEDDDVDVVVLVVNSGGGALLEVEPLMDVIEHEIKPNYRTVGWIESAISAACMTIWTCEELYMTNRAQTGGAVAFVQQGGGKAQALEGDELEGVLLVGEKSSRRGNRDPKILRAMQTFMTLSADISPTGQVTWHADDSGQYIVSPEEQILTLNSIEAERFGVIDGVANTKDELARMLGYEEWVEVGEEADEYQREFRENVRRAQVELDELGAKLQIAMEAGNVSRARRYVGEMKAWIRRAPSLETYAGLTRDVFREIERQIRDLQEEQREQRQRSRSRGR